MRSFFTTNITSVTIIQDHLNLYQIVYHSNDVKQLTDFQ